jgi:hypothetical protein
LAVASELWKEIKFEFDAVDTVWSRVGMKG